MGACVQPGDDVYLDRFEVEQELWQGRGLSPLLFNIFVTDVTTVVSQRFSKDTAILTELVHLKEQPTLMRLESTMDNVRRAVWVMLYAVDAGIVSRSPQELAKMVEVIVEVCRAFTLTVSVKTTEIGCIPPPRTSRTVVRVEAAVQIYKQVNPSPTWGVPLPNPWIYPLKSPGGPVHAGCVSGGIYVSSTISQKSHSPSRPEC